MQQFLVSCFWEVLIKKQFLVVLRKLFKIDINRGFLCLLQQTPEFFWAIFQHSWQLILQSRPTLFTLQQIYSKGFPHTGGIFPMCFADSFVGNTLLSALLIKPWGKVFTPFIRVSGCRYVCCFYCPSLHSFIQNKLFNSLCPHIIIMGKPKHNVFKFGFELTCITMSFPYTSTCIIVLYMITFNPFIQYSFVGRCCQVPILHITTHTIFRLAYWCTLHILEPVESRWFP